MILKNHKDLFLSLLLSLIPFFGFLSLDNIKQMIDNEIYLFFVINLFWTLIVLLLAMLLNKIMLLFNLSTYNVFKFSILNYIILFYFLELKSVLSFVNIAYQTEVFLILYFIFSFYLLFLIAKFRNLEIFFEKFIVIYIILNFFFVGYNLFKDSDYLFKSADIKKNALNSKILDVERSESKNKNVYYIVFDAMSSLDYAEKQGVIDDKNFFLEDYKKKNLTYIENSISNYNNTVLSLASIFNLSSKNTMMPTDNRYNGHRDFYSNFFKERKNNLSEILRLNNYKLYWLNDKYYKCDTILKNNINCYKDDFLTYYLSLNKTYLHNHLFLVFLNKFVKGNNNSVIFEFIKDPNKVINNLKEKNKNNLFIFGHIILPHPPWIFDKNCNEKINDNSGMIDSNLETSEVYFNGYKNNYVCTLEIINDLITSINTHDPDAIIIIQGDHGLNLNSDRKSGYYYNGLVKDESTMIENIELVKDRSMIFNLIKDNDECNDKLKANTNSNTAVFVLNCLFNIDLNYEEKMHHISFSPRQKNYGKVIRAF